MGVQGDATQLEESEPGGLDLRDHLVVESLFLMDPPRRSQNPFAEAELQPQVEELVLPNRPRGSLANELFICSPLISLGRSYLR